MTRDIDVSRLIDDARFNRFHWRVLFWCALIIIFDGYDLVIYGVVLPVLMKEWALTPLQAGALGSYALFGMMAGALVFGPLSDKIGRKKAITICVVLFSGFTVLNGFARNPTEFGLCRFIAGLGIGGVMPNVVAQMTEYAPKRLRATLVTLMFSGYAVGGVIAALLGKGLIEQYGWPSVFFAAGLPVLLIPFILRSMPESMAYLMAHRREDELKVIAARLDPTFKPQAQDRVLLPSVQKTQLAPIRMLFQDGRGFSTVMFWIAFFTCLFMVYALSSWLTKLMAGAGYSLGSALTFVLVLNLGAVLGAVGGGWLADRFNIKRVLASMYALAALSITLLGLQLPTWSLFVLVTLAGASTIGTQIVANAYAGQFYPMAIRATGLGWALGIGRSGAILAPILIGVLVGMNLPLEQNFIAIAIPALIGMVAVLLIDHRRSASRHPHVIGLESGTVSS